MAVIASEWKCLNLIVSAILLGNAWHCKSVSIDLFYYRVHTANRYGAQNVNRESALHSDLGDLLFCAVCCAMPMLTSKKKCVRLTWHRHLRVVQVWLFFFHLIYVR